MRCWSRYLALAVTATACVPPDPPTRREDDHEASAPSAATPPPRLLAAKPSAAPWPSHARLASSRAATGLAPVVSAPNRSRPSLDHPVLTEVYRDFFQRPTLGPDYVATSEQWRIDQGQLCVQGARNHPVWLRPRLPRNARIEFDAVSRSPDGDLKVEAWGDGRSAAAGTTYDDATGYLFILGGWKNQRHVLARLDEHGDDRLEVLVDPSGATLRARPVVPQRMVHIKIERADGRTLRWLVDDIEVLTLDDRAPLDGPGHEHFAFNAWDAPVCFDDLRITPL